MPSECRLANWWTGFPSVTITRQFQKDGELQFTSSLRYADVMNARKVLRWALLDLDPWSCSCQKLLVMRTVIHARPSCRRTVQHKRRRDSHVGKQQPRLRMKGKNRTHNIGGMLMATKQKPVHEIRLGRIRAAIWANQTDSGEIWFNVTVSRLYNDGNRWQQSASYVGTTCRWYPG